MKKNLVALLISVSLSIVIIFSWQNRYTITDWYYLNNYEPQEQIKILAENSGFNEYGTKLFYVNNPKLSNKEDFSNECVNDKEKSIVLGCYTGNRIYIYDVPSDDLKGVEEVTASHEMLHVAYDRLSKKEKQQVNKLLLEAYDRIDNPRIKNLIELYRSEDPSIVLNELHSIIGTEIQFLDSELEKYYSQYFSDRTRVVSLSKQYEDTLVKYNNEVDRIDADLKIRKSEIVNLEGEINSSLANIKEQQNTLNNLRNSNNVNQYNYFVNIYNNEVNRYNNMLSKHKSLINEYNQLINKRNEYAIQQQKINDSLDSRYTQI